MAVWNTDAISEFGIVPTGYERRLPPEVQLVVRARRRAVVDSATGRVLDLGGADSHEQLWRHRSDVEVTHIDGPEDPRLLTLGDRGERFDSIVSVFQLAAVGDLALSLVRLRTVLAEGGELLFLEPGRQTGTAGRLQRLAAPSIALVANLRVDRDIPASLRSSGMSVTRLDRHRVPTLQWWLRVVLEGSAHHALPPHRRADGADPSKTGK